MIRTPWNHSGGPAATSADSARKAAALEAARAGCEAARDRLAAATLGRLGTPNPKAFKADARFTLNSLPAIRHCIDAALGLARGLGRRLRGSTRGETAVDASGPVGPAVAAARPAEARRAADPELDLALDAIADARAETGPARAARAAAELAFAVHDVVERVAAAPAPAAEIAQQVLAVGRLGTLSGALDLYARAIEAWTAREARARDDAEVAEALRRAEAAARAAMALSAASLLAHGREVALLQARRKTLDAAWDGARAQSAREPVAAALPGAGPAAAPPWTPGHIAPDRRPLAGLLARYLLHHGQDAAYADRVTDIARAVGPDAEPLADWLARMAAITEQRGPASDAAKMTARVVGWSDALTNVHTGRPDLQRIERAYAEVMGAGQKSAPVRRRAVDLPARKERGRGYGD